MSDPHELDIDYSIDAVLPDDPEQARARVDWHARMVRHYTAQLAEEEASIKREITRLRELLDMRKATVAGYVAWHTAPIESYHRMRQQADPDFRTLRTPHATSKITVPKQPVVYLDGDDDYERLLKQWLTAYHPEALQLPGIAALRKLVRVERDDEGNFVVVDAKSGTPLVGFVASVPEPTYKLTPEEGTPL